MKKKVFATLLLSLIWTALDYTVYIVALSGYYPATRELWRPVEEIHFLVGGGVVLVAAMATTFLYADLAEKRDVKSGARFGVWLGLGWGVSMGFGTYAYMPLPLGLAIGLFFGSLLEMVAGGLFLGWYLRNT